MVDSAEASDGGEPEAQDWRQRALASEELVQQLKQAIRAQHRKIEELKALQEDGGAEELKSSLASCLSPRVKVHLLEHAQRDADESKQDRRKLEAQVRRLACEVKELRASNADLKRSNQRYRDMLAQVSPPGAGQLDSQAVPSLSLSASPSAATIISNASDAKPISSPNTLPQLTPRLPRDPGLGVRSPLSARASLRSSRNSATTASQQSLLIPATAGASPQRRGPTADTQQGGLRFEKAALATQALWREGLPHGLLHSLLHGAGHLVDPATVLTLYVADPWLRTALAATETDVVIAGEGEGSDVGGGARNPQHKLVSPTVYYLSGKETVRAYRRERVRAEPPRFPDLASLPFRKTGAVLALPLQAGAFRPILGALQLSVSTSGGGGGMASPPRGAGGVDSGEGRGGLEPLALSDGQVAALQLLCSTAAGIIDLHCRTECARSLQMRARECLSITAEVSGARTIADFEHCVKNSLQRFFHVTAVRLSFYNPATKELLNTGTRSQRCDALGAGAGDANKPAAAVGRRNITRYSIQQGIVGRCVRKHQVFHVEKVGVSMHVHEKADGLDFTTGRGREINMLAGPMVADLSDGACNHAIGVVQLLEKKFGVTASGALEQASGTTTSAPRPRGPSSGPQWQRTGCEPFTTADEDFFADMLKILGLAAFRLMQELHIGRPDDLQEMSVERLLAA